MSVCIQDRPKHLKQRIIRRISRNAEDSGKHIPEGTRSAKNVNSTEHDQK